MVEIGSDSVTISDKHGEIAHWIEDEWIQDTGLVLIIANAVNIYYTKGAVYLRALLGKEIHVNG
jgi:hypothetical protein